MSESGSGSCAALLVVVRGWRVARATFGDGMAAFATDGDTTLADGICAHDVERTMSQHEDRSRARCRRQAPFRGGS